MVKFSAIHGITGKMYIYKVDSHSGISFKERVVGTK
jgi:hypothetical protein